MTTSTSTTDGRDLSDGGSTPRTDPRGAEDSSTTTTSEADAAVSGANTDGSVEGGGDGGSGGGGASTTPPQPQSFTSNASGGGRKRPLDQPPQQPPPPSGGGEARAAAAAATTSRGDDEYPNAGKRARSEEAAEATASLRPEHQHQHQHQHQHHAVNPPHRVEVLWDVVTTTTASSSPSPDDDDAGRGADDSPSKEGGGGNDDRGETTRTAWWKATLLPLPSPSSGRPVETHTFEADEEGDDEDGGGHAAATVVVRVLQYDPNPEMGYPEKTLNKVAFLSDRVVYDIGEGAACHYRPEGSDWEPKGEDDLGRAVTASGPGGDDNEAEKGDEECGGDGVAVVTDVSREAMMAVVETILGGLLADKLAPQFSALSAARRAWVADRVATAKEKFVDSLMRECERGSSVESEGGDGGRKDFVITAEHVRRCMEEVGRELAASSRVS